MSGNIYAAIDLGTNNCRLLVARVRDDNFRVIDSFSRVVRLGEGLSSGDCLNETAMERTIDALQVCAEKMRSNDVDHCRSIATEACRRACDSDVFFDKVLEQTGIRLETISPEQEAQLTLDGCAQLLDDSTERALVFDIGGGSTELMWVKRRKTGEAKVLGMMSMPLGVVTLTEQYSCDIVAPSLYEKIIDQVNEGLETFDRAHGVGAYLEANAIQMLGTSGTVTTLGGIYLNLPRYDRSRVDGLDMRVETVAAISKRLAGMSISERANNGCIGQERADLVVMGCAIMEAICRRWPVEKVRAADRGIREGLLMGMMREHDAHFNGSIS